MNFFGDPEALTQSNYDAASNAFLLAYDEVGAEVCFQIVAVTVDTQQEDISEARRRRLEEEVGDEDGGNSTLGDEFVFNFNFSLFFFIIFQCACCPTGANLLTNDAFRRQLEQQFQSINTNDQLNLQLLPHQTLEQQQDQLDWIQQERSEYHTNNLRSLQQQNGKCSASRPGNCSKGPGRDRFQERF